MEQYRQEHCDSMKGKWGKKEIKRRDKREKDKEVTKGKERRKKAERHNRESRVER